MPDIAEKANGEAQTPVWLRPGRHPCPSPGCGSKTAYEVYQDQRSYCHKCKFSTKAPKLVRKKKSATKSRNRYDENPPYEKDKTQNEPEAADKAIEAIWNTFREPIRLTHKYLEKQGGIEGHGLRLHKRDLVAAYRDIDGTLRTVQTIGPDGDKLYRKGFPLGDSFFSVGEYQGTIYLGEGVGTMLAVHHVTKDYCVAAGSAGRLKRIALILRAKYPDEKIVICADNDRGKDTNTGLETARDAAQAIGAYVAIPKLPGKEPVDFADQYMAKGKKAVRKTIKRAKLIEASSSPDGATADGMDIANADLFIAEHADVVRSTKALGWMLWNGKYWRRDFDDQRYELIKKTSRKLLADFDKLPRLEQDQKFGAYKSLQSRYRMTEALKTASTDPAICVRPDKFDQNQMLLNCDNGTIELESGVLREHRQSDMLTRCLPFELDINAKCSRWLRFLDEIFRDDEMVAYIKRAFGYSLTGLTTEQCLFFCYGTGANGKSVLLEILKALLHEYAATASMKTFIRKTGDSIPNDLARLDGSRVVIVSETAQGARLDESLVKDATGGDTLSARFLRKEWFEFIPRFKPWFRGNHKPPITDTSNAIWRRFQLVNFGVTIPAKNRDPMLLDKLKKELPGILAWAVEGCLEWQKNGLQPPQKVLAATRAYRKASDVVGQFLKDRTHKKASGEVGAKMLYENYQRWCEKNGERPTSSKEFSAAMEERGIDKPRKAKGYFYQGRILK